MKKNKIRKFRGYWFISLWILGFIIWFLIPAINSFLYSFREINPSEREFTGQWIGFENYIYAFTQDSFYTKLLIESLKETFILAPISVIFSLFIAVMLKSKFKFRGFIRAVFFLPVIIATGKAYEIISGDILKTGISENSDYSISEKLFEMLGIYSSDDKIITLLQTVSETAENIIWYSGIQIFIFIAVLNTIPQSAKEVACIEGASEWEYFWKITVPYISPAIASNFILSAVNIFTRQDNKVIKRILDIRAEWYFGRSSAMAWAYFLAVIIFTAVFIAVFRKIMKWE